MWRRLTALTALLAMLLPGCLGDDRTETAPGPSSGTLTIYSSLPAHGVSAPAARAVAAGQRLAVSEARDRRIRLVVLSSTEPDERLWDPESVAENAERAADDPSAIAYLGELDHGASTISVPITNEAGLLQVSPLDGLTSLTRTPPGRPRSRPERLFPSGRRTFARLTPSDLLQAEALLRLARAAGARRLAVIFDDRVHGRELAGQVIALARRSGPLPARAEEFRNEIAAVPDLVRRLADRRADALVYAGVAGPATGELLAELARRMPRVPLFASGGLLVRDSGRPLAAAPERVEAVSPLFPTSLAPPRARRVLRRLERVAGPRARPEALHGYESARLVLDAIGAAGGSRPGVVRDALARRRRRSVLGRYALNRTGEVSTSRLYLYRLERGRFRFRRVLP